MPTVETSHVARSSQAPANQPVEILRTYEQVRAVQSEWEDFLQSDAGDHTVREQPFFMTEYLAYKKGGWTPFAVVLRDGGIRCIAPFYKHSRKIPLSVGPIEIPTRDVTILRLIGERLIHRNGSSVAENVSRLLDALRSVTHEFDAVWLPEMQIPGDFWDYFEEPNHARDGFRLIRLNPHVETVQEIELPASFDAYLAGFKGDDRRNRLRALRKLERAGNLTIDMFSTSDEMREFLKLADTVRNRSWKADEFGHDRFKNPDLVRFQLAIAERGWARGYLLRIDNEPVAYLLGSFDKKTFLADEWGYDDAKRSLSPGVGLIIMVLRHFCEDHGGYRVLLHPTESRMKKSLGNSTYSISHAVIVHDGALLSRMRFGVHRSVLRLHNYLTSVVAKIRTRLGR